MCWAPFNGANAFVYMCVVCVVYENGVSSSEYVLNEISFADVCRLNCVERVLVCLYCVVQFHGCNGIARLKTY